MRGRPYVMLLATTTRLRVNVTLVVLCTWAWCHTDAPFTDVLSWERAAQDSAAFHDTTLVAAARRAWLDGGVDRGRLAHTIADAPIGYDAVMGIAEPSSVADTGDQGDGFASVEPRAGPGVSLPSRVVRGGSRASLRSRSHSNASPRAPPVSLRLA